jgi:multidrug efflux pump subunit AcrA (membrane-fusion protein)
MYVQWMTAIPASVHGLLELFAGPLASLRFADIDREALERAAADVQGAAARVKEVEVELEAARAALQERQTAQLQQAQRALAYARIYAESDPALGEQLQAISLPRPLRKARGEGEPPAVSPAPGPAQKAATLEGSQIVDEPLPSEPGLPLPLTPSPSAQVVSLEGESSSPVQGTSGRRGRRAPAPSPRGMDDYSDESPF